MIAIKHVLLQTVLFVLMIMHRQSKQILPIISYPIGMTTYTHENKNQNRLIQPLIVETN
jgi:hypothetical protein